MSELVASNQALHLTGAECRQPATEPRIARLSSAICPA
jgi:hypothetical protein